VKGREVLRHIWLRAFTRTQKSQGASRRASVMGHHLSNSSPSHQKSVLAFPGTIMRW